MFVSLMSGLASPTPQAKPRQFGLPQRNLVSFREFTYPARFPKVICAVGSEIVPADGRRESIRRVREDQAWPEPVRTRPTNAFQLSFDDDVLRPVVVGTAGQHNLDFVARSQQRDVRPKIAASPESGAFRSTMRDTRESTPLISKAPEVSSDVVTRIA